MALDQVDAALIVSEQYLEAISALIRANILSGFVSLIPGVTAIGNAVEQKIAQAEAVLAGAERAIKAQVNAGIQAIVPDAISLLTSLTNTLSYNIGQLIGNIATTEDVLGTAIATIRAHSPELASWIYTNLAGSFGNIALGVLKEMETQDADGINAALDALLAIPGAPEWFTKLTHGFRHRGAEWQALALPALLVGVLLGATEAMQEPFQVAIRQGSFDHMPTKEAEPPVLVRALIQHGIDDARFTHGMRQNGYSDDIAGMMLNVSTERLLPEIATTLYLRGQIDQPRWEEEMSVRGFDTERARLFWLFQHRLLTEDRIREAFLRGIFTAGEHDTALGQYGYTQDRAAIMRQLYFFIPPVADLIHMAIRNVFNPEIVERFELFGDFPEPFRAAAAQQGISQEWAQRYWGAHWIVPSNTEGFEMFQRTTTKGLDPNADSIPLSDGSSVQNIIGESTLRLLLREKDVAPFYRDKLTELAYHPLTRIDIRRLHKLGLLSHAGVQRAYLDLGYSQENALKLADFTEKLNATTTKDRAAPLVEGLKRRVLSLYVTGKLSLEQVHATLLDVGFSQDEIGAFVAEAELIQQSERVSLIEKGIGKLYVSGFISDQEAARRLAALEIPVDAASLLFEQWDLEIEYRGGKESHHAARDLTKSEITEAFMDGMMNESDALGMLRNLGYDENEAEIEIGLALFRQAKNARKTQVDAVKAMYVNGVIEELEASNRLDRLMIPADQRDAYLGEWSLTRETRTEKIPVATVRDMLRANFLNLDGARSQLRRHRFSDSDIETLIGFWQLPRQ